MASDQRSLQALEALLNEFYNMGTSNNRKREIEMVLYQFKQQEDSWKQSFYYLMQTRNAFVLMFSLSTVENVINKQWSRLSLETRNELCSTLYQTVLELHKTAEACVRNKLVKLVVDIARLSWPHLYPDFLVNVLSLSYNSDTSVLCLVFLKTISEELFNSREEVLYERKIELKKLLLENIPSIVSVLSAFLDSVVEKHRNLGTATPPPSPTHGSHSPSPARHGLGSDLPSSLHSNTLVHSMLSRMDGFGKDSVSLSNLDHESQAIASLSLECVTHLFSWIPLASVLTPHLLDSIFMFASVGAEPSARVVDGMIRQTPRPCGPPLGVLAMGVINEILGKNYVPNNLDEFLLQTFKSTFQLLQKLTSHGSNLDSVNIEYRDKFLDFLRLFVSMHLRRFENSPLFPVLEFLELLYRYTFLQTRTNSYIGCLKIWTIFLEHLLAKSSQHHSYALKYKDALLHFSRTIMNKSQLRHNRELCQRMHHTININSSGGEEEEEILLDNENCAELFYFDESTEFQAYISQNVEIVAKVAELFPQEIFAVVLEPFTSTSREYLAIQCNVLSTLNFRPPSEETSQTLHCLLRDLASLLQAVGRFSVFFLGEHLVSRSEFGLKIMERLIEMSNFSLKHKLYEQQSSSTILYQDFVEVHAQTLSTMRAWSYWLSQLYGQQFVQGGPGGSFNHRIQETCHHLNKEMLHAGVEVLTCGAPLFVANCGAQLLSSLSVLLRSPVALEMKEVLNLYTNVFSVVTDSKIRKSVSRSLVNILLLPWPSFIQNHNQEARKQHLASFIHSFSKDFLAINVQSLVSEAGALEKHSEAVVTTLMLIRSQVDELNGTDKQSRETYYQCIQPVLEQAMKLFPAYSSDPDTCEEILSVMLVAMRALRHQMGNQRVLNIIQTFLEGFYANDILVQAIQLEDTSSLEILEKFLRILEIVCCEPGPSFKRSLPSTLTLCMDMVYPLVDGSFNNEIMVPLFKLLFTILDHNWKHFFKGSIQTSLGRNDFDTCQNEERFTQIIRAFGKTFMGKELVLFKQNLEALESLNSKYKLYHKSVVRSTMLGEFVTVLIHVLINRTHDALQEEIIIAIYNMASVDFEAFFSAFLPHFLQNMDGINSEQKEYLKINFKPDTDLPSFTQTMTRFINDVRYNRICGSHK